MEIQTLTTKWIIPFSLQHHLVVVLLVYLVHLLTIATLSLVVLRVALEVLNLQLALAYSVQALLMLHLIILVLAYSHLLNLLLPAAFSVKTLLILLLIMLDSNLLLLSLHPAAFSVLLILYLIILDSSLLLLSLLPVAFSVKALQMPHLVMLDSNLFLINQPAFSVMLLLNLQTLVLQLDRVTLATHFHPTQRNHLRTSLAVLCIFQKEFHVLQCLQIKAF